MKEMPTQQRLRELLAYDHETGSLTWRVSRGKNFPAGSLAAWRPKCNDYWQVRIDGNLYQAHRLLWVYYYGTVPNRFIDHINGDRQDNRICNLRDVSDEANAQNIRAPKKGNQSGVLGVVKYFNKWAAYIDHMGKTKYLGLHQTAEEAHQVYIDAKRRLHAGCTL